MIAMVIDSALRCIFLSDGEPDVQVAEIHTSRCRRKMCNRLDFRKRGRSDKSCQQMLRSRWWVEWQFTEADRVLAQATKMSLHIHSLSTRDKEVLGQLAHSRSNAQIAKRLGITVSTVEKHRSKIRQTLGVSTESDLQLAAWIVANPSVFRGLCSRVFPQ